MFTNERLFTIQTFTITRVHCSFQFVLKRRKPMTTSRAKRKVLAAFSSICSSQSSCKKVPRRALWCDIKHTWAGSRIAIATFWQCVKHIARFVNLNRTKLEIITVLYTEDGRSMSVCSLYGQLSQGWMADFPAFIASKSFDLWNHYIPRLVRHLILLQTHKCSVLIMCLHIFEIKLC